MPVRVKKTRQIIKLWRMIPKSGYRFSEKILL